MPNKASDFIKSTKLEMKKVTWPTREETIRYTLTVITISAALAIFLGGLDYLFEVILNKFVL